MHAVRKNRHEHAFEMLRNEPRRRQICERKNEATVPFLNGLTTSQALLTNRDRDFRKALVTCFAEATNCCVPELISHGTPASQRHAFLASSSRTLSSCHFNSCVLCSSIHALHPPTVARKATSMMIAMRIVRSFSPMCLPKRKRPAKCRASLYFLCLDQGVTWFRCFQSHQTHVQSQSAILPEGVSEPRLSPQPSVQYAHLEERQTDLFRD